MNDLRLDTRTIMEAGILDLTPPDTAMPNNAILNEVDENNYTDDELEEGLINGGLKASMYYGCWAIWNGQNGYSGELLQYREITEFFEDQPLNIALAKARCWARECAE